MQTPSEEVATIRPHIDGMYGLPAGSLNFWVPLTAAPDPSAALWVESAAGREDFHPLTRATRFDGRRCLHFSLPNRSERTRVSLDFRCVPGGLFDAGGRLARAGYFSAARRQEEGGSARFAPAHRGRVSILHGLPHRGRPLDDSLQSG